LLEYRAATMDPISSIAAAGIRARMESLDLLANNLANSGTPGFKADREAYRLYSSEQSSAGAALSPVIETHVTDFTQGLLAVTSNPGDLAISGDGFLSVDGPHGELLTRNGKLHVTQDGKLVTPDGFEVTTIEPKKIRLNPQLPFEIGSDGGVSQGGSLVGHLRIAEAQPGVQPAKQEGAYFRLDASQTRTVPPERFQIRQGHLESSNFSPAEASVKLIGVLRQFETLQKAMQLGGEMGRKAVEDVARATP